MDNNKIYITDDDGKEVEMNVYFTFTTGDKNYVLVYETGNEDDIFAFTFDDDGNLFVVEDEEELEMIEEVIGAFEEDHEDA